MTKVKARSGRPRGTVTIADVATKAGVSRATVSRVMNGRSTVAADIAERVIDAAEKLNYRPSNIARSLSLGRTNTIALMVPDLGNPMFQQILRGVMAAAAPFGYRVLVADAAETPEDEAAIALEARQRCDALILVSPRMPDAVLPDLLQQVSPAVLVNRSVPAGAPDVLTPSLSVDYVRGMRSVVEHLVSLGHKSVVYLSGPHLSASNTLRLTGLHEAQLIHPSFEVTVVECGPTVADGFAIVEEVLATRATAVIAFNDLVAFGLLSRLNETGVAVPDDISIVGCDDIELARYATPSLTTLAVPQSELGRHAWQRLQDVITGTSTTPDITHFEPRLEIRASTGPAPVRRRPPVTTAPVGAAESGTTTAKLAWRSDRETVVLEGAGLPLARYTNGQGVPAVHAPRPHLHPIHTLGGAIMTETSPVDHRHHYGLSVAVPEINSTSFWGGRTFVRDVGPTLLANHGQQVSTQIQTATYETGHATLDDAVTWLDHHGDPLLEEDRRITGLLLPDDAWMLRWTSDLRAQHGDLTITSPGATGRPGAGYGGLFWRLPAAESTTVLSAGGEGEETAHGSRSPWVAFVQRRQAGWTTLLLAQDGPPAPWFVRAATFPGAGPARAWDAPLSVPAGDSVRLTLVGVLLDRRLALDEAAALATTVAVAP